MRTKRSALTCATRSEEPAMQSLPSRGRLCKRGGFFLKVPLHMGTWGAFGGSSRSWVYRMVVCPASDSIAHLPLRFLAVRRCVRNQSVNPGTLTLVVHMGLPLFGVGSLFSVVSKGNQHQVLPPPARSQCSRIQTLSNPDPLKRGHPHLREW